MFRRIPPCSLMSCLIVSFCFVGLILVLFGVLQGRVDKHRYIPTQLGMATLSSALSPDEALVVFAEVQKARKCFVLESELHIIYQVSANENEC